MELVSARRLLWREARRLTGCGLRSMGRRSGEACPTQDCFACPTQHQSLQRSCRDGYEVDGVFARGQLLDLDTLRSVHGARPTSSGVLKATIAIEPAVISDQACRCSPSALSTALMRLLDRMKREARILGRPPAPEHAGWSERDDSGGSRPVPLVRPALDRLHALDRGNGRYALVV